MSYTGSGSTSNRQIQIGTGATLSSTVGLNIENVGATGPLVFSNANFNVAAPTYTGARTLTLQGSNSGSNQISGIIVDNSATGTIGITKDGAGTWVLAGLNTYGGQTRIDTGTLSVNTLANSGSSSALGTGSGNPVINIGSSTSTGTLIYTGSGNSSTNRQIQIGRSSTGTGGTLIQNDSATGVLTFSNANFNTPDLTVTNTSAIRTLSLQGTNTGNNTISGVISNNVGSGGVVGAVNLVKTSAGTWVLGGVNTFSGQVRIDNGTLSVNSIANTSTASALGTGGTSSTIVIGAGTSTGTLIYTGSANATSDRQIQIGRSTTNSGGTVIQNDSTTGTLTFSNTAFNTSDLTITNTSAARTLSLQGSNTGNNMIAGIISNNVGTGAVVGAISLAKAGIGTWTLSGANTYSGGTSISAGTLNINSAGSGGTSSALGTGALTITGGTIDNTSAGALTLGTNNAMAFNGSFAFGGTQDLNLGTGIVSIGGSSRTLTLNNSTTLTLGQLQWSSDVDRTLTVNQGTGSGGNLILNGFQLNVLGTATASRTRTINGSGNVKISAPVVDGNSFANNLVYSGSGVLTLSGANSYTGTTTISAGSLQIGDGGTSGSLDATSAITNNATFVFNRSDALTIGTVISGTGAVTQMGGGTTTLTASNTYTGQTTINAGSTLQFGNGGAAGNSANSSGILNNGTLTFNRSGSPLFGMVISGTGAVNVVGPGTVILSATNSYTGTTTINSGSTLQLGSGIGGGTIGNISTTNGVVVNNGTLIFNRSTSGVGFSSVISGPGAVNFTGTGSIIFNTAQTYTGQTTINVGSTLQLGSGGAAGSILNTSGVTDNGTLVFNRSGNPTSIGFVISGTGALNLIGTGTITLAAANTYSGPTTIGSGTLQLGFGNVGGTVGSIDNTSGITNNATLAFNRSNALNIATAITGTGAVRQIGGGTTTLSAINTYAGATTVTAGTLAISGSINSTSSLSVTNGSLLLGGSQVINDSASVTLANAVFNPGGNSEFAGAANGTGAGLGALILNSTSTIDFGAGSSTLWFSGITSITGTLNIANWSGDGNGGGSDQLRFSSDPSAFLSQISFAGSGASAIFFDNGGNSYYEVITPIPEPATSGAIGALGLFGLISIRERRRLRALLRTCNG